MKKVPKRKSKPVSRIYKSMPRGYKGVDPARVGKKERRMPPVIPAYLR